MEQLTDALRKRVLTNARKCKIDAGFFRFLEAVTSSIGFAPGEFAEFAHLHQHNPFVITTIPFGSLFVFLPAGTVKILILPDPSSRIEELSLYLRLRRVSFCHNHA